MVFRCHNQNVDLQQRIARSAEGWSLAARAAFHGTRMASGALSGAAAGSGDSSGGGEEKGGEMTVAVHLRRGDVLQSKRVDTNRLVSFGACKAILRQVLSALGSGASSDVGSEQKRRVRVVFLVEGAPDAQHVMDYRLQQGQGQGQGHGRPAVSAVAVPKSVVDGTFQRDSGCIAGNNGFAKDANANVIANATVLPDGVPCQAEVLWKATPIEAFQAMCSADILISSLSSFPFAAAALCEPGPKVTVAMHFSQGYAGVPGGVVEAVAEAGGLPLWKEGGTTTLPGLASVLRRHLPQWGWES